MKALFLTRDFPYPPHGGTIKRNFYLLKELKARGIEVILITRKPHDIPPEDIDKLKVHCTDLLLAEVEQSPLKTAGQFLLSLCSPEAFSVKRRYAPSLKRAIASYVKEGGADIIICDSVYQAKNIPFPVRAKTILYEHNIESVIIARYAQQEKNRIKRFLACLEQKKVEAFQEEMWKKFDCCIVCSQREKQYIEERIGKGAVFVINNGVDSDFYSSNYVPSGKNSLIYTGRMGWFPNEDAVLFFLRDIFPLIKREVPDVTFWVVGVNPTSRLKKIAQKDPSVVVTGSVDDVRPFMERASVYVVPLRIGSGTRLKILEALSMNKAVVSTPMGCEGLDVEDNKHLLIRNHSQDFAAAVIKLLKEKALRSSLGENGRLLVQSLYDWRVVFKELDAIMGDGKESLRVSARGGPASGWSKLAS